MSSRRHPDHMHATRLVGLCLLLVLAFPTQGSTLRVQDQDEFYSLAGHLYWFRDRSGALGVDEIVAVDARNGFRRADGFPTFGYSTDTIWVRFRIDGALQQQRHWLLSVAPAFLDEVDLYQIVDQTPQLLAEQGDHRPWTSRRLGWRHNLFELELDPQVPTIYYLRITSTSSLAINATLWQPTQLLDHAGKEILLFGILIAAGILIAILSLVFFALLKQRTYLYFFLYMTSLTLIIAHIEGMLYFVLRPQSSLPLEWLQVLLEAIGTYALLMLSMEITGLSRRYPRANYLVTRLALVTMIAGILPVLWQRYDISIPFFWVWLVIITFLIPFPILLRWSSSSLAAKLYAASFAFVWIGFAGRFLWVFGFRSANLLSENYFVFLLLIHNTLILTTIVASYMQLHRLTTLAKQAALRTIQESERKLDGLVQQKTAELDDANRSLQRQLEISHDHAAELERTRDRLHQALASEKQSALEQKRFLRMVAHEFRTPLTVIQTATDLIASDPLTPEHHASVNCGRIQQACERLTSVVNQALNEDRLDSAVWRTNAAFVSVQDILRQGVIHVEMVSAGRHPVSMHCPAELTLQGDRELLVTMVNNIVDNAVKYSPGGGAIELSADRLADGCVRLVITDHGRGMSSEESSLVLDKYFRAEQVRDVAGMGLGLYLVDRIVRLHGATLAIDSTPQVGSCFTITFPPGQSKGASHEP